ncbi:outer membrane protein [Tardiphaga sp. 862_B3_N1_1]|uniref:outer membrane protein n=1 Tax=Tardiphaga sp. 862_B3_N1_1 TaxID=3240763 RepID=UPI003F8B2BEC
MKSVLTAAALIALGTVTASAADMAARPYTKAPPMVASWNWSGFYVGGNVGYGVNSSSADTGLFTPTTPPVLAVSIPLSARMDGVVGGGQIGWNTMFAPSWLFGIEADIQAADQRNTSTVTGLFGLGTFGSVETRLNWFGTVRGRLGWTATPETLLYVTGGYAYGEVGITNSSLIAGGGVAGSSSTSLKDGWTVGGGIETRLWNSNWTAKAEYLYVDLGSQGTANLVAPAPAFTQVSSIDVKDHIFRVGLNYKLGNWAY